MGVQKEMRCFHSRGMKLSPMRFALANQNFQMQLMQMQLMQMLKRNE